MSALDQRHQLAAAWYVLASASPRPIASIALPFGNSDVRIAIDSDGARHLLFPTALPTRPWSQFSSPLRDCVRKLAFAAASSLYLDVSCSDAELFSVFDELVLDILSVVSATDPDPGAKADEALHHWRLMFSAASSARFGKEKQFGLFAELSVLEAGVALRGIEVVDAWVGPDGSAHDFELKNACIEVKAASVAASTITVHGFGQLMPELDKPLVLAVYTLIESADGRTIRELITSIESATSAGILDASLARLGYTTSVLDDRLAIADSFGVFVDETVPALTSETVRTPLTRTIPRVQYDVDVDGLRTLMSPYPLAKIIAEAV
ncbi:MAG: PD-(D/E)XK motif protein [Leifsonia sp.]